MILKNRAITKILIGFLAIFLITSGVPMFIDTPLVRIIGDVAALLIMTFIAFDKEMQALMNVADKKTFVRKRRYYYTFIVVIMLIPLSYHTYQLITG